MAWTLFTFGCTTLGSAFVFFFKKPNTRFNSFMMSFASGIMLSASFFSLIEPAISYCENLNMTSCLWIGLGFLCGFAFMILSAKILEKNDSTPVATQSLRMLNFSMTLHNIPEGMSVGIAFALVGESPVSTLASVMVLAIGIGIQNIPEGASISLPMYSAGVPKTKAFLTGMMTGIAEPISAIVAYLCCGLFHSAMPFILAFAGANMIYVSLFELLPDSTAESKYLSSISFMLGFTIMMILDIAL